MCGRQSSLLHVVDTFKCHRDRSSHPSFPTSDTMCIPMTGQLLVLSPDLWFNTFKNMIMVCFCYELSRGKSTLCSYSFTIPKENVPESNISQLLRRTRSRSRSRLTGKAPLPLSKMPATLWPTGSLTCCTLQLAVSWGSRIWRMRPVGDLRKLTLHPKQGKSCSECASSKAVGCQCTCRIQRIGIHKECEDPGED